MLLTTNEAAEVVQETVEQVNAVSTYFQNQIPELLTFGIRVVLAILFFGLGRIVIKWTRKIVRAALQRSSADVGVEQFIDSMIKFGLYAILIFTIATKFGVDTASVAAIIASAGVAIGLALQGSLSNFAGGVLILLLKPFVVGDYIIEDNNKNEGTVKEIQLFYTKLTTIENKTIVIPNGMLTNNSLINVTAKDERRLDLKINISYEADLKKAKMLLMKLLKAESRVLTDEEIVVFVDELGLNSVVLGVRAWTKTEDYWNVRWELLEQIKLIFDENGIEIPYQQMRVHMENKKTYLP